VRKVFASAGVSDAGPYVLPRSGTYTVNVVAGASDADFLFRLLDLNASSVPFRSARLQQDFAAVSLSARMCISRGRRGTKVYLVFSNTSSTCAERSTDRTGNLGGFTITDAGPVTLDQPNII
jgi:hypothetical protein